MPIRPAGEEFAFLYDKVKEVCDPATDHKKCMLLLIFIEQLVLGGFRDQWQDLSIGFYAVSMGLSDEDIDRRYLESIKRLNEMPSICERIYLYDNTDRFIKVAGYKNGKRKEVVKTLPKWVELTELF